MMFCKSCGSEIPDGTKFCENCGAPVETVAADVPKDDQDFDFDYATEEPVPEQPAVYDQNDGYNDGYAGTAQRYEEPSGGGMIGFGVASMVCGIVSLLCCCAQWWIMLVAIVAIVLGAIALLKSFAGKGMAVAGLITGCISLLISLILWIMATFFQSWLIDSLSNYVDDYSDVPGVEQFIEELEDL